MGHNSIDTIPRGKDKRIFKVCLRNLRLPILGLVGLGLACSWWGSDQDRFQLEILGIEALGRAEVVSILGLPQEPVGVGSGTTGYPISLWDRDAWQSKLAIHPRIESVGIDRKGSLVRIHIRERSIRALVQIDGVLYELDEKSRILSRNDVRNAWLPVLTGSFKVHVGQTQGQGDRVEGASFYALQKQVEQMFEDYPALRDRISEVEIRKDGDLYLYLHQPSRMVVNIGNFLSRQQARKLYASLAYMEADNQKPRFLDLRGEDAFYY